MNKRQIFGRWGEETACRFLARRGFNIITRNWHCRDGEVDIVAEKLGVVYFVEVKTRHGTAFGHPEEFFDAAKEDKVAAAGQEYLIQNKMEDLDWQLALVAITVVGRGRARVKFLIV